MFGFFTRSFRPGSRPRTQRAILHIEMLEDRLCPSSPQLSFDLTPLTGRQVELRGTVTDDNPQGITVSFSGAAAGSTTTDSTGAFDFTTEASSLGTVYATAVDLDNYFSNIAQADVTSAAPALTLAVTHNSGRTVTLSGQVADANPGGLSVNFSGVVAGSTTTDATGAFSFQTDASGLGTVQASTTNIWGLTSDVVQADVASDAPAVTLAVARGSGRTVTLSGQLTDANPGGLTVNFSGVVEGSTTTDAAGNFSFQTEAADLGTVQASTTNVWGQSSNVAEADVSSAAPSLSLALAYGSGPMVTLSGQVADASPGGLTVTFSGVVTGTTVTNADGTYSFQAEASGLGTVQASTTNVWGQSSNVAEADVTSAAPSLTLSVTYGSGRMVTLSGQVTDASPGGLTVTFSGVVNGSVVTNADGSFSLQTEASELGTVQAGTVNVWGLASAAASVDLAAAAPVIQGFTAAQDVTGKWTFEGQVAGPDIVGSTVRFGGDLPALQGQTAAVAADGCFQLVVSLPTDASGLVTALTTDGWGQDSNQASFLVVPPN